MSQSTSEDQFEFFGVSEELICCICLDPFDQPMELRPCSHLVCKNHLPLTRCPLCRDAVRIYYPPNRVVTNLAAAASVRCKLCDWVGTRLTRASHACPCLEGAPVAMTGVSPAVELSTPPRRVVVAGRRPVASPAYPLWSMTVPVVPVRILPASVTGGRNVLLSAAHTAVDRREVAPAVIPHDVEATAMLAPLPESPRSSQTSRIPADNEATSSSAPSSAQPSPPAPFPWGLIAPLPDHVLIPSPLTAPIVRPPSLACGGNVLARWTNPQSLGHTTPGAVSNTDDTWNSFVTQAVGGTQQPFALPPTTLVGTPPSTIATTTTTRSSRKASDKARRY